MLEKGKRERDLERMKPKDDEIIWGRLKAFGLIG